VPNSHATTVVEVDDLGRLPEAEHVEREHTVVLGQRGDGAFPADVGADAEFAAVQQDDRITLSRFQITGGQAVDENRLPLRHAVSHAARA
jgi:hypothetical protein